MEIDLDRYMIERDVVVSCINILSKRKDCKTAALELQKKLTMFDMRIEELVRKNCH